MICRMTGKVLWHLSGPIVSQQHCAHQINPEGDILILDNGAFRPGISVPFSRAIVVSKEKRVTWEYMDASTGGLGFFYAVHGLGAEVE